MKTIPEAIAEVKPEPGEQFSPTRYPYTYACDYLRQHPSIVPAEVWADPKHWSARNATLMARAEASGVRRTWARLTGVDDFDAAVVLADAFLTQEGITPPDGARESIVETLTRPA